MAQEDGRILDDRARAVVTGDAARSNNHPTMQAVSSLPWDGTNGGVINGGVSPTIAETNTIDTICAELAGFARNWLNSLGITRGVSPLVFATLARNWPDLRGFGRICYAPLCSYLIVASSLSPGVTRIRPRNFSRKHVKSVSSMPCPPTLHRSGDSANRKLGKSSHV